MLFDIVFFFVWFMFIVIWANIYCCYLSFFFFRKRKGLRIMFGGRIDFGVMICSQYFYDKSYAKNCYWWVKKLVSVLVPN